MCQYDPPAGFFGDDTHVLYAAASGGSTAGTAGRTTGTPMTLATAVSSARHQSDVKLLTGTYSGTVTIAQNLTVSEHTAQTATATGLYLRPAVASGATVTLGGVTHTAGTGVVAASVEHMAAVPAAWAADGSKMGLVYCHGATRGPEQIIDGVTYGALKAILNAAVLAGYPILAVSTGDTWGNDTGMARIDAAKTYLQGAMGAKAGAVGLIGASMGGCTALNWAKRNLAATACVVGIMPVSDVSDIHTNNRGTLAASINAAYGGAWVEATHGAARNPATFAAAGDLAGLKYQAWGGASDAICLPATVSAVVTSIGGTATYTEVAGDHNSAVANITPATVVAFLDANQT